MLTICIPLEILGIALKWWDSVARFPPDPVLLPKQQEHMPHYRWHL